MKSKKRIECLSCEECKKVQGGGWGYDVGWLLGNTLVGNLLTPRGIAEAVADYQVHYLLEE